MRLIKRRDRLIGALLIGNNLVNILASAIATSMFLSWFGDKGVGAGDPGHDGHRRHLCRGDAEIPGDHRPPTVLPCACARSVSFAVAMLSPFAAATSACARWMLRLLGVRIEAAAPC